MSPTTPKPSARRDPPPDPAALARAHRDAAARARSAIVAEATRAAREAAPQLLPATVVRVDVGDGPGQGPGLDGDALCWVVLDAAAIPIDVPYPDTYTPQVGHQVELLMQGDEARVLHRLRGIRKPPGPDELEV